jgi:hypothetical protein
MIHATVVSAEVLTDMLIVLKRCVTSTIVHIGLCVLFRPVPVEQELWHLIQLLEVLT